MLGVCSWSLAAEKLDELVERVHAVGVRAVQLALDPVREGAWKLAEVRDRMAEAGIEVRSGMMGMRGEDYSSLEAIRETGGVRPDRHWAHNLRAAEENAAIARELGLPLVSFHAGFFPHEREDRERDKMLRRVREIAERFGRCGVSVALETGQETAATLLEVLADIARDSSAAGEAAVGVNFDPANMLLYGMGDPVAALQALAPHVKQVHVKDARATRAHGAWGEELPVGDGEVDWESFFRVLAESVGPCDLMIEREAGSDRIGDIRKARMLVERLQHAREAR